MLTLFDNPYDVLLLGNRKKNEVTGFSKHFISSLNDTGLCRNSCTQMFSRRPPPKTSENSKRNNCSRVSFLLLYKFIALNFTQEELHLLNIQKVNLQNDFGRLTLPLSDSLQDVVYTSVVVLLPRSWYYQYIFE